MAIESKSTVAKLRRFRALHELFFEAADHQLAAIEGFESTGVQAYGLPQTRQFLADILNVRDAGLLERQDDMIRAADANPHTALLNKTVDGALRAEAQKILILMEGVVQSMYNTHSWAVAPNRKTLTPQQDKALVAYSAFTQEVFMPALEDTMAQLRRFAEADKGRRGGR